MTDPWVEKPLQLGFLLGEFPLFSLTFRARVLEVHFSRLPLNPDVPRPPFEEFSSGWEAAVILAHPIREPLPRFTILPHAWRYVPTVYRRSFVDLRGSFQDYLGKLSSKRRYNLRSKMRRARELSGGEFRWREFRAHQEMPEFLRLGRQVSTKSWQGRLLGMGLPEHDEFRREISDLAARGAVRAYILFDGDQPISFVYARVEEEGILVSKLIGYDPEYRHWSPGIVLHGLAFEKLFAEGELRMFDFAEGTGEHKKLFETGSVLCADIYYFRRTAKNFLRLALHTATCFLSRAIVHTLQVFGWKERVKKFFRRIA